MTLFDGKSLTEEEVRARDVCKCGHMRGEHVFFEYGTDRCTKCECNPPRYPPPPRKTERG